MERAPTSASACPRVPVIDLTIAENAAGRPWLIAGTRFDSYRSPLPGVVPEWGLNGHEGAYDSHARVAAAPSRPRVVYKTVETPLALFYILRSEDGGETWREIGQRQRPGDGAARRPARPRPGDRRLLRLQGQRAAVDRGRRSDVDAAAPRRAARRLRGRPARRRPDLARRRDRAAPLDRRRAHVRAAPSRAARRGRARPGRSGAPDRRRRAAVRERRRRRDAAARVLRRPGAGGRGRRLRPGPARRGLRGGGLLVRLRAAARRPRRAAHERRRPHLELFAQGLDDLCVHALAITADGRALFAATARAGVQRIQIEGRTTGRRPPAASAASRNRRRPRCARQRLALPAN